MCLKNRSLLPVFIAAVGSMLAREVLAQAGFAVLHTFSSVPYTPPFTNRDGGHPHGQLLVAGDTLYGTTWQGGASGNGTVFAMKADGTGFTNLYGFTGPDGAAPSSELLLSGATLYGTASQGGSGGSGAVFAIKTEGTGFTNLYSFTTPIPYVTNNGVSYSSNADGAFPYSGLTMSGNALHGTTGGGGSSGFGSVFAINIDGTGFRNLHNFSATVPP